MGKRDVEKERFWRAAVARQRNSGLSVRLFCRRENLAESNFYAWRRELRVRDSEVASESSGKARPATFVPVTVNDAAGTAESITLTLASGHVLQLPVAYEPESLGQLLVALAAEDTP